MRVRVVGHQTNVCQQERHPMEGSPFHGSLSRRPVPELVAERIMAAIVNGTIKPGDKLPSEPELARQLEVGRTSLREALSKLQATGAVEVIRGKGTFVREPQDDDPRFGFARWSSIEGYAVAEVLEARIAMESTAAGLACARATQSELDAMSLAGEAHQRAHQESDLDEIVATDEAFHSALLRSSHNELLESMYTSLVPRLQEFRRHTHSLEGAGRQSVAGHDEIFSAIEKRNPSEARRAVVEHLWSTYAEVLAGSSRRLTMRHPKCQGLDLFVH